MKKRKEMMGVRDKKRNKASLFSPPTHAPTYHMYIILWQIPRVDLQLAECLFLLDGAKIAMRVDPSIVIS